MQHVGDHTNKTPLPPPGLQIYDAIYYAIYDLRFTMRFTMRFIMRSHSRLRQIAISGIMNLFVFDEVHQYIFTNIHALYRINRQN
jgi:hypothetical protein